jgi:hypothetical protein
MSQGKPVLVSRHADLGLEVWAVWDEGADLYGLYASQDCNDPIGEASTMTEARQVARWWYEERMA